VWSRRCSAQRVDLAEGRTVGVLAVDSASPAHRNAEISTPSMT
jgi:hypothetical protein